MSTTTMPLPPVRKSAIALLWIGLLALMVGAAAWAATLSAAPHITLVTERAGSGPSPTDTDVAIVKYEGRLADGTVFDANDHAPLPVGQMVPGFAEGLKRMQVGGKYSLHIPSSLAYGEQGGGPIPPNADINFTVELLDFRSMEEVQRMMQQQQMLQQMQQQHGGAGAAGGAGEAAPGQ